jgi:hypothetical protein
MSSLIDFQAHHGSAKAQARPAPPRDRSHRSASPLAARPGAAYPDAVDIYVWLCQAGARAQKRRAGMAQSTRRRMVFAALRA